MGVRPDLFVNGKNETIIVECCSCYISKIIKYPSRDNAEVLIITRGYGPWDEGWPEDFAPMEWFVFKRGKNWEEMYKRLEKLKLEEIKKIKSPLDTINQG